MRYLGIDYGTKKVGLALSDEAGTMGFPHAVVSTSPRLLEEVKTLIIKEGVGAVVIGESRSLSGDENPVAKEARAFAEQLQEAGISVFFEPELYTTQAARRTPEGDMDDPRQTVDAQAASLILTSYLERHDHH